MAAVEKSERLVGIDMRRARRTVRGHNRSFDIAVQIVDNPLRGTRAQGWY